VTDTINIQLTVDALATIFRVKKHLSTGS